MEAHTKSNEQVTDRVISDTYALPANGAVRPTGIRVIERGGDTVIEALRQFHIGQEAVVVGTISLNDVSVTGDVPEDDIALCLLISMSGRRGVRVNPEGIEAIRSHPNWGRVCELLNRALPPEISEYTPLS